MAPRPSISRQLPLHHMARSLESMRELKQLHAHLLTCPCLPAPAAASLLSRLLLFAGTSPTGSPAYALALFHSIPSPSLPLYNTAIRGRLQDPLSLYKRMLRSRVRPDHLTFPFLLKHCGSRGDARSAGAVHAHVAALGFHADLHVGNVVVYMYADLGSPGLAAKAFDEMPHRDAVSWNSMLVAYLRCGELLSAMAVFGRMEKRNIVSWNAMIAGFARGGQPREALALFREMLLAEGDGFVGPDEITTASVVSACATLGAVEEGEGVHSFIRKHGLELDKVIGTALVDMYGKCGLPDRATEVFDKIKDKDVRAWTTIISALAVNGCSEEAFSIFEEMEKAGVRPNYVTFGALLSTCVHSGLLEKGWWCFNVMRNVYSVEPNTNHYACMVDLLGRAGRFEEALRLIGSMTVEPDAYVWGALLGGCQMHRHVELGERVCEHLIDLDPMNHAFYVSLLDMYAKGGRFDDVKRVRMFMNERGIEKALPGCSSIEVDGRVYEFSVKGALEVPQEVIEEVLNEIDLELKSDGKRDDQMERVFASSMAFLV